MAWVMLFPIPGEFQDRLDHWIRVYFLQRSTGPPAMAVGIFWRPERSCCIASMRKDYARGGILGGGGILLGDGNRKKFRKILGFL